MTKREEQESIIAKNFSNLEDNIDIGNILRILRRRKKIVFAVAILTMLFTTGFTGYKRIYKPVYSGSFKLLIEDPILGKNKKSDSLLLNLTNDPEYDTPTLIVLLKSPVILSKIADEFSLNPNSLSGRIKISTIRIANKNAKGALKVKITAGEVEQGRKLLKRLSEVYLETAYLQKQQKLQDGLDFLNEQTPLMKAKTQELQDKLANFRKENSLLDPELEGISIKELQKDYEENIRITDSQIKRYESLKEQVIEGKLSARGFKEIIESSQGNKSAIEITASDQSLLDGLLLAEDRLIEARSTYTENSAVVKGLKLKIDEIRPELKKSQLNSIQVAINSKNDYKKLLQNQIAEIEVKFLAQPNLIKEYNRIRQNLEIWRENLVGIIAARERFQLEMAQNTVPWKVISPPKMGSNPVEPNVSQNLTFGLIGGLFLGIILALLRDEIDNVFHTIEQVKNEVPVPHLGHIPYVDFFKNVRDDKRIILEELDFNNFEAEDTQEEKYQRFFFQEALRNFYTSIRFINSDNTIKSLCITSSLPSEGKSLVNILLAKTLADMGLKILLIDADMRKPQLHFRFGLNNILGLSNYLIDKNKNISNVVQKVEKIKNLNVITAGKVPPDPTRLLGSDRMKTLLNDLKISKDYDLVLIDAPPVLGLADLLLISENTDGIILLISLEKVRRDLPPQSIASISNTNSTLLGCVTNSTELPKANNIAGGSYGYGYEYASEYSDYANIESSEINSQNNQNSKNKFQIKKKLKHLIDKMFKFLD